MLELFARVKISIFRFNPYLPEVDVDSLGRQVKLSAELDGLVVTLPEAQS